MWESLIVPEDQTLTRDELMNQLMAMEQRALAAEKQLEALQIVASYAQDVVAYWPKMSIRTVLIMAGKVNGLKEALDQVK